MSTYHPKVQALIDSAVASYQERISLLEEKLKQYEQFDAQKADLEGVINALTKENAELTAEVACVTSELLGLKSELAKLHPSTESESKANEVPAETVAPLVEVETPVLETKADEKPVVEPDAKKDSKPAEKDKKKETKK